MKRKLILLLLSLTLTGCANTEIVTINTNSTELSNDSFGTLAKIAGDFYYDTATLIVYKHHFTYNGNYVDVPYYAPNGLPYRYNTKTNTLEEIEKE